MKRNLVSVRDRSGSCAIILLVTESKVYVANVGDSRAIISKNHGEEPSDISRDHKPGDPLEQQRIIAGGGKVYQSNQLVP